MSISHLRTSAVVPLRADLPQPNEPRERIALTAEEAARQLGVSGRFLRQLADRREIPHVRLGRRVLFPREALLEWVARAAEASTA